MRPASLSFTLFGDYFRDLNVEVWVGSLIKYLGALGITENAARVTFSRMMQQGWLHSRRVGQKSYYALSSEGKRRIIDGVMRVYDWDVVSTWDRQWQIVCCDLTSIQKDRRERFRRELQWMGFGQINRTTWISPHQRFASLKPMIEEYQIAADVHVFTGTYEGMLSVLDLVSAAWNLEEIQRKYEGFINEFGTKYQKAHQLYVLGQLTEEQAFVERTLLVHEYRKFLFVDPRLPKELLPDQWIGDQARKLFREYHQLLSPLAEKYFYQHLEILDEA